MKGEIEGIVSWLYIFLKTITKTGAGDVGFARALLGDWK